jgi:phage terminase large subunit-like protein
MAKTKRKSALEIYCTKVVDGREVACAKIKKVCQRLLNDIKTPYKQWHFDIEAAERPVRFIERFCKVPSGRLGAPLKLEDYEKAWIEAVFGFVDDDGIRRYQEVLIEVARKNGKSSLAAAIELYMLLADGEGSPQIYNAANSEEQAKLAYNAAWKMVRQSSEISKKVRKRTNDMYCDANFGTIAPLSSNTSSLDGLDVHLGILDEIHAMKNREIFDLLKQGTAARSNPLILMITTNGFTRNGLMDQTYEFATRWLEGDAVDDRFLAFIYELDSRDEWTDEKCWKKSNPGLGTIKKLSYLRDQVKKAKQQPEYRPTVLTKDFDMPENSSVAWLNFEEAVNPHVYTFEKMGFRYGIVGFDASDSVDLTAAQMLIMKPDDDNIYERSMYWIPEDVILRDQENGRKERDGVPYQQWIKRGLMRTVEGNIIDKRVLIEWMKEMRDEYDVYTFALGYDPWHMTESYLRAELEGFVGKSRVNEVRQGTKTLSQPMKQLRAEYQANRLIDNNNPLNQWNRMNVMVKIDDNLNIRPTKKGGDPRNRIDGFMAELDAYITLLKFKDEYTAVV